MELKHQKGFTLIELILYITLVTIVLSSIIPYAWNVINGQAKTTTQQEVSTQARILSEKIKQAIRNASNINTVSATSISLAQTNPSLNPTVITYSNNKVTISQGSSPTPIPLHSNNVKVQNFSFTNYTSSDQKTKHIGFTFTMLANYTSGRQEYQQTTTIESSAELRSN